MCVPPTMMTGGLIGHTIAQANESDKEEKTVNNYYGQQTQQTDPIVEANKASLKTSPKQTSQKEKAY